MAYNATVYASKDGKPYYTGVAEVREIGGRLQMLRGNGVTCTGYEGRTSNLLSADGNETALYDYYRRQSEPDVEFKFVLDNCAGYNARINRMGLPPAYKSEE